MIRHGDFKFKGRDGSMGYRTGETYRLSVEETRGFFQKESTFTVIDWNTGQGRCPYGSLMALMDNWEKVSN